MWRTFQAIVRGTSIFTALLLVPAGLCAATPPQAKEPMRQTGASPPQILTMPVRAGNLMEARTPFFRFRTGSSFSPFSVYTPDPYAGFSYPHAAQINPYAGPLSANSATGGYGYPIPAYSNPYLPAPGGSSGTAVQKQDYNTRKSPQIATSHLLDTFGLPTVKGRLGWPLGLRILAPALEAEDLRFQISGLMQNLALEVAAGHVQPGTVELAARATAQLRYLFRKGYGSAVLAEYTQQEANHFLDRLDTAIRSATSMSVSSGAQR
jgi:hypothetical protein